MFKYFILYLILAFGISSGNLYSAEEDSEVVLKPDEELNEEGEIVKKKPLHYFKINPNIITTYQNTGKKMKYIVVQVQIVVRGEDNYDTVETHMPLLQDALTDFFNRQDKIIIEDLAQRETLRLKALERVDEVLLEELGEDVIEGLIFTQYVYQ